MVWSGPSIAGVDVQPLQPFADERGRFVEFFRASWGLVEPVQWNLGTGVTGSLRGVHVHVRHTDYVTIAHGAMVVGLQDVRRGSATFGRAAVVTIEADDPVAVVVPPGVAHGFLFEEPAVYVVGVSRYWDADDELGCRWSDPGLRIPWTPPPAPLLSARDATAGGLDDLVELVDRGSEDAGAAPTASR